MFSPKTRRLSQLSLVIASTLATLIVLECALRIAFAVYSRDIADYRPGSYYSKQITDDRSRFISHPFLPYAGRPFDARKTYRFRQAGGTVPFDYVNNSLGFRTPERPFKKPMMTKRVITLGGSTTFDGPTNEQTWPALLERRLNDRYATSGYKIEVINLAVDSASSPYNLINLAFIGVEYEPDLVISYDGVNDSYLFGNEGLTPDYRSQMEKFDDKYRTLQSRLPQWAFKSYLVSWASFRLDRIMGGPADLMDQVFKKTLSLKPSGNPLHGIEYFERNLRIMRAISTEYGARFLAATAHWVHPGDDVVAMNEELRRFFGRTHIDFLDLDRELPHDDWSIHLDPVHWTSRGTEAMAERWEAKIIATDALGLDNARHP